ncbi:MAG TPA: Sir2 family NAD-dependent protein deacetylase [Porticoccaceae bacterium]|nr:Sir2 family NAD-dependent protein deacetylase [Porticoccaceae bacterium]
MNDAPVHAALRELFAGAQRAVIFTGAGISTESGIPDFRSPGGIWSRHQPVLFENFLRSEEARRASWRLKFALDETLRDALPNRGHRAIAELIRRGTASTVITQNVDGLHQAAGVAEDRVIELHGNTTYARCLDCRAHHELAPIRAAFLRDETLPICERCGGLVKTATISFGQAMPGEAMARAETVTRDCDLFLVLGSSLVVQPAAGFPLLAKRGGARLAIVNREPTPLDHAADLVLHEPIGATLGAAVGAD